MERYDILIIGGGAAGIAAAKAAYSAGCSSILLIEHKGYLGGVLQQCTHRGFGTAQNGPEYIAALLQDFPDQIQCLLHTTAVRINPDKTAVIASAEAGERTIAFSQLILAAGCREIPPGALPIAGMRPKGVYTAGQMQEMMNLHGVMPQSPVVILGSGDLGLIMAAQIVHAGGQAVLIEQNDACGGMERNRRNIEALSIPVLLNTTIAEICGEKEIDNVKLTNGTVIPCKTLLIAVGLCPNRELLEGIGSPEWLYLCGNCNQVHTMIESVVYEGKNAGIRACEMLRGEKHD